MYVTDGADGADGRTTPFFVREKISTKLIVNPYIGEKMAVKFKGLWRLRAGDCRIIYEIQKSLIIILVLKISDRKDVYSLPS